MQAMFRPMVLLSMILAVSGCATITNGTTQAINIDSDPAGAECTLVRGGQQLTSVTTPSPVTIKRDQQTLHVRCRKEGYEESLVVMNSRFETASAGNFMLGGIIGVMVDSSTGANAKYDPYVMVRLQALSPADQSAAAMRAKAAPVAAGPVPSPPEITPVAAIAPGSPAAAAGPFDGSYGGSVDLPTIGLGPGKSFHGRVFELKVAGGVGTGTSKQSQCDTPGRVDLTVDPSGAVKGTANTQDPIRCAPRTGKLEGRMEGNSMRLSLRFQNDATPVELVLNKR